MKFRWKRWAAGGAGFLALYTLAGFALVPYVIRSQVPKVVQDQLERKGEIGEVKFNPFTLRLEAHDIRLSETSGAPLFGVGSLTVDLDWISLPRRAWSFGEIHIVAPSASLAIAKDGRFNIAELLATIDKKKNPEEPSSGLPRLVVDHFAVDQGKVEMKDEQAGYSNALTPIEFALDNFSTLPDRTGPYTFSANSARGGKILWKGEASVNPIHGSGELSVEGASLPEFAVYLKSYAKITLAAGKLSVNLPYRFAYSGGKFEASLNGAKLALTDFAVAHEGAKDSFATLTRLNVSGINADLARRVATVESVTAGGGKFAVKRDAKGQLDVANLMAESPAHPVSAGAQVTVSRWKLGVKQVAFEDVAVSAIDETVTPPVKVEAGKLQLHLAVDAEQADAAPQVKISNAQFSLDNLAITSGAQSLVKVARLGFADGEVDLAAHRAVLGRLFIDGGEVKVLRDAKGQLNLMAALPKAGGGEKAVAVSAAPGVPAQPWSAVVKTVELGKLAADIEDQGSGIHLHAQEISLKLENASSDLKQAVKFNAGFKLKEGGDFSAQGSAVPASGAVDADVKVKQLALAIAQPMLAKFIHLKLARGSVNAAGRVAVGGSGPKAAMLRYTGGFEIAGLLLNEDDGDLFASWKSVGAEKMLVSISPNRLEIPELRVLEPNAKLLIENDRSFNAARLLVKAATSGATVVATAPPAPVAAKPAPATARPAAKGDDDPFPIGIRRIRFDKGKLDFTDLSLRPQFGAKIHELSGVITGLSSSRNTRSQIELDGQVDEFGLARVRGGLNPFAPRDNTDVNVVFKNVDMVSASPYTMKFAGYKIAEGKISLDLKYKVRDSKLEGDNQIVIDQLKLGERVDSPDALKLPLELAIAILKDSDGRIDLGLPVSGDMNDPQFSYGAVVWKAIGNVLTKLVTAPFRALGSLLGISGGEKLEAIEFDPGSAKLLPPEREKIKQVAQVLAKRAQLKLTAPAQYSEAADGAAIKARLVRDEIAKRASITLAAGEEPGPLDLQDRHVRSALRDLYTERFGKADFDKAKAEAEKAGGIPAAPAPPAESAEPDANKAGSGAAANAASAKAGDEPKGKISLLQRAARLASGEPQVADAGDFYRKLRQRLDENQPLAADALTQLGTQRAQAIVAALAENGVDASRATAGAPEKVSAEPGKAVPLKLALGGK
ncbi:MAG: hypothetical protein JWN73_1505 [Betaproteobacteria bacterium]|nr:hypothetical protein [Betaproteobacteria bacterium]